MWLRILPLFLFVSSFSNAQKPIFTAQKPIKHIQSYASLTTADYYLFNLETVLKTVTLEQKIVLPNRIGEIDEFTLTNSQTLSPTLQKQFPSILSFSGYATANTEKKIRIDFNEKGLFAWIKSPTESYFIHSLDNINELIVFDETSYKTANKQTYTELEPRKLIEAASPSALKTRRAQKANGGKLRTYRLAVSCTGEYAAYHGGTKALALSAIVTSINRVNEVFENDLAVRLELIPNMEVLLFTNPATDPYVDNNSNQLIDEVQIQIDQLIGKDNYDVGQVFSTGGGGIAQLASVCGPLKGSGVTGSSNPIGDPFDIDFVAHELGHQFGAEHTFNSDQENCSNTGWEFAAYEPGSGSTIMAYAGICEPHNLQQQSDAYFHTHSIDEIVTYINGKGSTCGSVTLLDNTPPTVTVPESGFFIPISTPFKLTGSASDNEDQFLTYCWEEYDLGPFGPPTSPQDNAPLFRSFIPSFSPSRYFPQLGDVVTGQSTFGELLPTYSRDLTFRLTVRDNHLEGGGVNDAQVAFKSTDQAGPFVITSQETPSSYEVNEIIEVTWNVANTNASPVNCSFVKLLLSTDGGYTYPITLLENTPNDGKADVTIPNTLTSAARIKVEAIDNVFYNINTVDFNIIAPSTPSFALNISPQFQDICPPDSFVYAISLTRFSDFNENVNLSVNNLPSGLSYYFTDNELTTTDSTELILKVQNGHVSDNYEVMVVATSSSLTRQQEISLRTHVENQLVVKELQLPENNEIGAGLRPVFKWQAFDDADDYVVELSTESSFETKEVYKNITSNEWEYKNTLVANTTYFWRVKGMNNCGSSDYTTPYQFTTVNTVCQTVKNDTPVPLPNGTRLFSSTISSTLTGLVTDVNVKSIKGVHEYTSDLLFYLESPSSKSVKLLSDVCDSDFGEDFNMGFDDASTSGFPLCPPTDGFIHLPIEPLAGFIGEKAHGNWLLYIRDEFEDFDAGTLESWELEICAGQPVTVIDQEVKNSISVFPNPTTGVIEFEGKSDNSLIKIYDSFGQLVGETTNHHFDTIALKSGVYFYVLSNQGLPLRGKFVKF